MKNNKYLLLVAAVVAMFATSCSSDYHYANSFIRKFKHNKSTAVEQIYVCLPTGVIHTNSSLNEVDDFALLSETRQDSVIASMTRILDKIDDSIFLDQFNNAFLYTLSRLRVPVVLVDDPALLPKADDTHFTVHIAQLEAEEYIKHSRSDFYTNKGKYYAYDYDLTQFATNVWLRLDATDSNDVVYFKSDEVGDTFKGTVTSLKDGKATLKTDFKRITVNDAYYVARSLGRLCATLYVEKILTEYVCRTKGTNKHYFYYNPMDNSIDVIMPYSMGVKESFEKM